MIVVTRLEELRLRHLAAEEGRGARSAGRGSTARASCRRGSEWILLLDEGTFEELDKLVTHRSRNFGLEEQVIPGDGLVTGYGQIEGRLVYTFAQDFTVLGGSLIGEQRAERFVR